MRSISTKLVLAVLAAVALPFLGFTVYLDQAVNQGFTRRVTEQALMGVAADISNRLDLHVTNCSEGLDLLGNQAFVRYMVEDQLELNEGDLDSDPIQWESEVWAAFDRRVGTGGLYDLILLVDSQGGIIASNRKDQQGVPLPTELFQDIYPRDFFQEEWFRVAMGGYAVRMDQHRSNLLRVIAPDDEEPLQPSDYHLGFGLPLYVDSEPQGVPDLAPDAVLFALVNWESFQTIANSPVIKETFRGLVREGQQPSPYAWVWDREADKILGHQDPSLYGTTITGDLGLDVLTQAVNDSESGWELYPRYQFRGMEKTAAFKLCNGEDKNGFGWVVGVGIDDEDMFASTQSTRSLLQAGSAAVLLIILLWTMVIARRMTRPIHALQELTESVASGNLEARLEPQSKDELGALTVAFNRMTGDLAAKQEQLIRVEKDAAWREMARQIAHDIKNSLTPIKITLGLLQRAHAERSPQFETILDDTLAMMQRKVVDLDEISKDFQEFTGGRKPNPTLFGMRPLVDEVFELYTAMGDEQNVSLGSEGDECQVYVDRHKLSRVLENLVTNALQAMPDGGALLARIGSSDLGVTIELEDNGIGVSDEAREHLFEPYFTTRSEGTGLGLAISSRVLEDMGASLALEPRRDGGRGTMVRIVLPPPLPLGAGKASGELS
jgi:signal transduction histidine kinase